MADREEEVRFDIRRDVIATVRKPTLGPELTLLRIEDVDDKEPELCSIWTVLGARAEQP
jgi:hypothetical protein